MTADKESVRYDAICSRVASASTVGKFGLHRRWPAARRATCAPCACSYYCARNVGFMPESLSGLGRSPCLLSRVRGHEVSRRQDAFVNRCGSRRFGDSSADGLHNARGRRATLQSAILARWQFWDNVRRGSRAEAAARPARRQCPSSRDRDGLLHCKLDAMRSVVDSQLRLCDAQQSFHARRHLCRCVDAHAPAFLDKREDVSGRNRVRRRSATAGLRRKVP
ncbi:hypothetical protein QF025_006719 [Paraburkholderia graminis]|uniref:Uncharacterized protein n=1 Tax=Paraburkholderia graminis TaxID=60548 RepID=A0ABD5CS72_9BURK|nr:hypothetical protein [Paraburkholderia graminis]